MKHYLAILSLLALALALLAACVDADADDDGDAGATDEPTPTADATAEITPTPEIDIDDMTWMDRGRFTILLAGSDEAEDRSGVRTDVMMVASINVETGHVALFGIPRNLGDVPLSDNVAEVMGVDVYTGMLKWLYGAAQDYPELAPNNEDPGLMAVKGAAEGLLGIPVDYYAMVDMVGFVELVDLLGGIEMDVTEPVTVRLLAADGSGWEQYQIQRGWQTLSGGEALAYARSRTGASDYARMRRQRCLVAATMDQAELTTLLRVFPDLVEAIRDNVHTNLPLEILPDLVMLRDDIRMDELLAVGFTPPDYILGRSSEGFNLPDVDLIQETVQSMINDPEGYLASSNTADPLADHCEPPAVPEPTTDFDLPEPTPAPEPTPTPEPSPTPEPTQTPQPTPTPEPTQTPQPTPTATPDPEPSPTPEPELTPTAEPAGDDTADPESEPTPTPETGPEPTPPPEDDEPEDE